VAPLPSAVDLVRLRSARHCLSASVEPGSGAPGWPAQRSRLRSGRARLGSGHCRLPGCLAAPPLPACLPLLLLSGHLGLVTWARHACPSHPVSSLAPSPLPVLPPWLLLRFFTSIVSSSILFPQTPLLARLVAWPSGCSCCSSCYCSRRGGVPGATATPFVRFASRARATAPASASKLPPSASASSTL